MWAPVTPSLIHPGPALKGITNIEEIALLNDLEVFKDGLLIQQQLIPRARLSARLTGKKLRVHCLENNGEIGSLQGLPLEEIDDGIHSVELVFLFGIKLKFHASMFINWENRIRLSAETHS